MEGLFELQQKPHPEIIFFLVIFDSLFHDLSGHSLTIRAGRTSNKVVNKSIRRHVRESWVPLPW